MSSFVAINKETTLLAGGWEEVSQPVSWPPRNPDLTPRRFFLWGYANGTVYQK
jgi:hypothetical protein